MVLLEESGNDSPKHATENMRVTELRKDMHFVIPGEDNADSFFGHKGIVHLRFVAQCRTVI